jgi:SAM-dependent methyltransferase
VPWYHAVAERDHDIQNPTSPEKIRVLGEYLRLGPESRVLDIASGKCGPALILAQTYGCRLTCVERAEEFTGVARERVAEAGLDDRIEIVQSDAREFPIEPESYDAALCLGATFVWDGLQGTLDALVPAVPAGGGIAIGEVFWHRWPLPEGVADENCVTLPETAERIGAAGLALTGLIGSSQDDWDRYESLHWRAAEEWLAANPDDPDVGEIRRQHEHHREHHLRVRQGLMGWAIFVCRRP